MKIDCLYRITLFCSRLSLISRQPLGGSSLSPGSLEIMMDRRLMQDDNRGLFQGVLDNHVTPHSFYLVLERKIKGCQVSVFTSLFKFGTNFHPIFLFFDRMRPTTPRLPIHPSLWWRFVTT